MPKIKKPIYIFFKLNLFAIFQADMQSDESQMLAQHHYAPANHYQYDQGAAEGRIESQYKTIDPDSDFYIQRLTAIRDQIDEELQMYSLRQQQMQEISKLQAEQIDIESRETAIGKRALRNDIGPFQNDPMAMGYQNSYSSQTHSEYSPQITPVPTFSGGSQNTQQQSPCAKNLLVGCQPHVQLVPCSSSYESHPQPYPIQQYQPHPQPAPIHQYQPQPAPPYQILNSPHFRSKIPVPIPKLHNSKAVFGAKATNQTVEAEVSSINEVAEISSIETTTAEDVSSDTENQTNATDLGTQNTTTDSLGWIQQLRRFDKTISDQSIHKSMSHKPPPRKSEHHDFGEHERHMMGKQRQEKSKSPLSWNDSKHDKPFSQKQKNPMHDYPTFIPLNTHSDSNPYRHFAPRPFHNSKRMQDNID